ncbi:MAG: helix-turn-helix domain-containing protein [Nitrosomonas sp.]|nr:MAG: helix-turn-helix domain-containing protein [Nitrosomonas sp.]
MSSGIGRMQQRIMAELAAATSQYETENCWALTVMDLAERTGVSDRQVRRAVRSLEQRGLVVLIKERAWLTPGGPQRRPAVSLCVWLPDRLAERESRMREVDFNEL